MKEKIGIEKLIELLNEYGKEKGNPFNEWGFNSNDELFCKGLSSWYSEILIISKKFGFIKWLVENDKIDTDKLKKIGYEKTIYMYDGQYREIVEYSASEAILMLLSISSSPIDDLISYLK